MRSPRGRDAVGRTGEVEQQARVRPDTRVFGEDGSLDRQQAVGQLTQWDGSASTLDDQDRCGPTSVMAANR